jgi:acyl-CoA synthetase (NDP forming)
LSKKSVGGTEVVSASAAGAESGLEEDQADRNAGTELAARASAAAAAMTALLHPQRIAVVGASSDPTTIAGLLFGNLVDSHFGGVVLPVNLKRPTVRDIPAYPDLRSCPVVPDLVVACVPASIVPAVVAEAGDLGVKAVCVISAGFAETGADGVKLQDDLVREAMTRSVRLVGPNCAGILAGEGPSRFNATFSRVVPPLGRTSLLAQSGAIGLAVLEAADARGLGIGDFVSVGNSPDDVVNDLVLHWGEDARTEVILLYVESIQNPKWFARIARDVGRRIPVVAVKSGRTEAGSRGAASHTAALAAGDTAVEALFHQAGVIRAESIEEMLDLAAMLGSEQHFAGRRVAIVTNGGGPGVLAADACEANGLAVPELSAAVSAKLRSLLTPEASVSNPVDMIASATAEQYGKVVRVLGSSAEVDAVLVMFNTPLITRAADVATELNAAHLELPKEVALVTVFMNREGPPSSLAAAGIPSFAYPENAARALQRSVAWEAWRNRAPGKVLRPRVDPGDVERIVTAARGRASDGWLTAADSHALLACYGIADARALRVHSEQEAAAAQAELGCTVAVKVAAAIHKTDVGGVRLGVATPAAAADALREIRRDLESAGMGEAAGEFLVQELIESGQEMIVGVNRDPALGPLVLVGLGGSLVEVLGDVAVRIAPLTDDDVAEMLASLKSYRLLTGFRGAPPLDAEALRQVLHRVSALVDDVDEVVEMDLNPVFVLAQGAIVADARIRLQ